MQVATLMVLRTLGLLCYTTSSQSIWRPFSRCRGAMLAKRITNLKLAERSTPPRSRANPRWPRGRTSHPSRVYKDEQAGQTRPIMKKASRLVSLPSPPRIAAVTGQSASLFWRDLSMSVRATQVTKRWFRGLGQKHPLRLWASPSRQLSPGDFECAERPAW
jgi:hypothetical protein